MTPEQIFKIWAPSSSIWSPWAKPVMFTQLRCGGEDTSDDVPSVDLTWLGDAWGEGSACIVDLPSKDSMEVGLALVRRGYRPVPLYNSSPGPKEAVGLESASTLQSLGLQGVSPGRPTAAVDMSALLEAACRATRVLLRTQIDPAAPPAFLLDAARLLGNNPIGEGVFDNRWMTFPQDFPSANFLKTHGIQSVLLIQRVLLQPQEDLAHVLLRWQESGISIDAKDILEGSSPAKITVARPSRFKRAWYRALAVAGLRRSSAGGFGSVIPETRSAG
jgi:hypothetical protein